MAFPKLISAVIAFACVCVGAALLRWGLVLVVREKSLWVTKRATHYKRCTRYKYALWPLRSLIWQCCKYILCSIYLTHSIRKVEFKTIVLGLNLHTMFEISCDTNPPALDRRFGLLNSFWNIRKIYVICVDNGQVWLEWAVEFWNILSSNWRVLTYF